MENEKRLIDANALLESFGEEPEVWSDADAEIQARNDWHRYQVIVKCQPIVDAVEVVRCENCLWARYEEDANAYWCNNPDLDCSCYRPGDGFCESGERREGE